MRFWHKKRALSVHSELTLGKKVFINHLFKLNGTPVKRSRQLKWDWNNFRI